MHWWHWTCGFLAGAALASYLTLSCAPGRAQSEEVAYALDHAADTYGVAPGCLWGIARRESGYRPWINNYAGSGAGGLMQFMAGTYRYMAARAGYPTDPGQRYNAWNAAHVAAWAIAHPYESQGGLRHWGGWC